MSTDRDDEPLVRSPSPVVHATVAPLPTEACAPHVDRDAGVSASRGLPPHAEPRHQKTPHMLAAAFERELLRDGRVHDLHWFRTDWQRSGAATATARYRDDDGVDHGVVVKLPVTPREWRWSRRLGTNDDAARISTLPVARLFRDGTELGPYDVAWIIIERFQHEPLATHWLPNTVARIADAAARFHQAASAFTVDEPANAEDWEALVKSARDHARDSSMPERSRWSTALKELSRRLDKAIERWAARRPIVWLHGDLHPANALARSGDPDAPAALIDLAEVRAGHWLEDAIYLERLLWTRPERLGQKPVKALAEARKRLGLENGDYPPLAAVRRVLLAATAPAFRGEHHPALLAACLARLEEGLRDVK
jgi:hypothetical protein